MRITVNGETREVADQLTIAELLEQLQLGGRRVALEVNQEIVPRSEHAHFRLPPDARVEIVNAIGGG
ncbi:sulfur carrier protein ThiS [Alkalilimnicola sp. S0819]|uniref:sulfur carrier protein ThiS n=1 Tax=Alkalilimnicola sp. S0819 TaxID=2613922 RepID=UPI0012622395|nr:sulfur carrier protein ThiS [Alkalilimnicola sp. S0819]KAB7623388.1 sulfur carrier protein ThiS [Alkalilimnicola sp. S0819]MPQ16931.1 sulfur carrier protein ThiS [Alkalilimnicola sp. S0819]